jgi:hypothetical protein
MTQIRKIFIQVRLTTKQCWTRNKYLTALTIFSLFTLLVSLTGLAIDHKMIMGEYAWVKPVKFSASLALYGMTLYWLAQYLTNYEKAFRRVCLAALVGSVTELTVITTQVLRGAPNHFNMGTGFDNGMAWLAAVAIMPVAYAIVAIFFMLLRERNLPPVLGCALKWGAFLSIVGCVPGLMMLAPAAMQGLIAHTQHVVTHVAMQHAMHNATYTAMQGALHNATHTAMQGAMHSAAHAAKLTQTSSGLPFLGWSTVSGDLRVAHFVGIHALQFFPLAAFLVMKALPRLTKLRQELLISNIGITYGATIALLTRQAILAEPLTSPSHHTLAYAVLLALVSINAAVYILFAPSPAVPGQWQEAES